eukprot:TRINITY_DN1898_c0_g2_i2.p1 TRINITY_DN1898_c0_g2~~TRINITY_DN1898_c0_g2_i2.p1  ORF type:complete len:108 (+),score=42.31 TRINITY_DN1898_c0_g2_i2:125-448(+)
MVVVVFGFPSKISALQFEWEWQNPTRSRRMQDKIRNCSNIGNLYLLRAKIRVLYEMLSMPPWRRFPLRVNWNSSDHQEYVINCPTLPIHIDIQTAPIEQLDVYITKG